MSKDARKHLVLVVMIFLVAAAGMASVFTGCRMLAWMVIAMSDSYLSIVLLLAAIRSDGTEIQWPTAVEPDDVENRVPVDRPNVGFEGREQFPVEPLIVQAVLLGRTSRSAPVSGGRPR